MAAAGAAGGAVGGDVAAVVQEPTSCCSPMPAINRPVRKLTWLRASPVTSDPTTKDKQLATCIDRDKGQRGSTVEALCGFNVGLQHMQCLCDFLFSALLPYFSK